jgi:hypothetical protein
MAEYSNYYKTTYCERQSGRIEQLLQLLRLTWDGDLISKAERDTLVGLGLAQNFGDGWNLITSQGVKYLYDLGFIHP